MKDKEITFEMFYSRLKTTNEVSLNKIKETYEYALK